jgi:hypothetical protein
MRITVTLSIPDDVTDTDSGPGFDQDCEVARAFRDLAHRTQHGGVRSIEPIGIYDTRDNPMGFVTIEEGR